MILTRRLRLRVSFSVNLFQDIGIIRKVFLYYLCSAKILCGIISREYTKVVVLYKDRLARFGFELIEYIASLYNCIIEIVDSANKTEEQELVEDLVQIIIVFSCKLQGKRAGKIRKMIKELTEDADKDI